MSDNIYGEGQVTTVGNMTVTNITHKPKRMQGDHIRNEVQSISKEVEDHKPTAVTLESAIKYYEENAVGEFEVLYNMTAKWLETLRKVRIKKIEETIEHVQSLVHGSIKAVEGEKES
jgi:methylthioribose-1-phosphate isomerase